MYELTICVQDFDVDRHAGPHDHNSDDHNDLPDSYIDINFYCRHGMTPLLRLWSPDGNT